MIVGVVAIVRMGMPVIVRMRVGGAVGVCMGMVVPMRVLAIMLVFMAGMITPVIMVVRVKMLMKVMWILDPLLALTATADAAHQTTSISLSRISLPP